MTAEKITIAVSSAPLALIITSVHDPRVQAEYERRDPEIIRLTREDARWLGHQLLEGVK